MYLHHRDRGTKEARDVWIRGFPLPVLNNYILESLSKSEASSNYQKITIAKLILGEIMELDKINRECLEKNFEVLMDIEEVRRYLEMFEKLFQSIIADTQWMCESKSLFIELVWKYRDEGTVNFEGTRVPQLLLQAFSSDRLDALLLAALMNQGDESHLKPLLQACTPACPRNFQVVMEALSKTFQESHYHPNVMSFTRTFVTRLQTDHSNYYLQLYPIYFRPLISLYRQCSGYFNSSNGDVLLKSRKQQSALFTVLLLPLETIYNPENMDSADLDAKICSFYVAAACPHIVSVICKALKSGQLSFKNYPCFWTYLRSDKRERYNLDQRTLMVS